jgi:hypothetical protein
MRRSRKRAGGSSGGDETDINLTGQVAASVIQNPWTIVSASAIGGLVAGGLTLFGVWITQSRNDKRDERNRAEDARKSSLEERKKAYAQFAAFMTKWDLMVRAVRTDPPLLIK